MGTRGFLGIKYQEKETIGTYNHFDSYPSGLGQSIVTFIVDVETNNQWNTFIEGLLKVRNVDGEYVPTSDEIETHKEFADMNVSNRRMDNLYVLLRNLQDGEVLTAILEHKVSILADDWSFYKDPTSWGEFFYIIDLDKRFLQIEGARHNIIGKLTFEQLKEYSLKSEVEWLHYLKDKNDVIETETEPETDLATNSATMMIIEDVMATQTSESNSIETTTVYDTASPESPTYDTTSYDSGSSSSSSDR